MQDGHHFVFESLVFRVWSTISLILNPEFRHFAFSATIKKKQLHINTAFIFNEQKSEF